MGGDSERNNIMPKLLAIECSTDACSVALGFGQAVQEHWVLQPREHHKLLLPMVMELFQGEHDLLTQIDGIAYGRGPGSFTGLRLCAGIVQGLAFALKKPVIPVSSLAATVLSFAQEHSINQQILIVALDARMGDVYAGVYDVDNEGIAILMEDRLLSRHELEQVAETHPKALKIGSGWAITRDCYPHAAAVLALAEPRFRERQFLNAMEAMPVYLRETISWQKWQPKAGRQTV